MCANFACIKIITPSLLLGKNIFSQLKEISNVFHDARLSESSIIILDNLEGILGFDANHTQYNNEIRLQLTDLLDPKKSKNKCIIIATASHIKCLSNIGLSGLFEEQENIWPLLIDQHHIEPIQRLAESLGLKLDTAHMPPDAPFDQFTNSYQCREMPLKKLLYIMMKKSKNGSILFSDLYQAANYKKPSTRNTQLFSSNKPVMISDHEKKKNTYKM